MDNPFKSPVVISFCPGILGLERGIERAIGKIRVAAYVEIEAFICANLVAGMESGVLDPAPIWTDAKTFDARPFRGRIHGIIGGYPCPGESTAGLREGHLYKGFLWPVIRRAIAAARPLWCFFENVDDHLTGTYPIVQRSLHNMGYRVEAGIYTAEEVGAPHERKRLFVLAISDSYLRCGSSGTKRMGWETWSNLSRSGAKSELAYGDCHGHRAGAGGIIKEGSQIEGKEQWQEGNDLLGQWMRDVIGDSSEELVTKWPARPGEQQHEWEEPRTIESGMGCTINGYNFREDLLRALGNSVVEQTAELAFLDLISKHLKNL